jgi:tRNA pseudouridine55 synthase
MGRRNRGRDISGIVVLDKPLELSSNKALQIVKRIFNARKAGHTGSLDPLATGILPICFGEATKISNYLFDAVKHYRTTARLGAVTSTGDTEGEVIERHAVPTLEKSAIEAVLERFTGEIEQIPPMFSALKHKGQPLYKLAREGVEVEREPRRVTIYSLQLLGFSEDTLELDVSCSRGTYIRTLVEDIGRELGCGAHVEALRRIGLGPYGEQDMLTLDDLRACQDQGLDALMGCLQPVDSALIDWPKVELSENLAFYLKQGQPVQVSRAPTEGLVRLYDDDGFLGIGQILDDGRVAPKRLMHLARTA